MQFAAREHTTPDPIKTGVIFNDTGNDHVRFVSRERGQRHFTIKHYDTDEIEICRY